MQNHDLIEQVNRAPMCTTGKYKVIPSKTILEQLTSQGFSLDQLYVTKARKQSRIGFQKHFMRFRHENYADASAFAGESIPELLVINSYDGTTSVRFMVGVFRFICANGLIAGDSENLFRVIHRGDKVRTRLDEAMEHTVRRFPIIAESIQRMQNTEISGEKALTFAKKAAEIKLNHPGIVSLHETERLLIPRRGKDNLTDVYTIFNRVQESLIRPLYFNKFKYRVLEGNELKSKITQTREVKGISELVRINTALWNEAEKLAA